MPNIKYKEYIKYKQKKPALICVQCDFSMETLPQPEKKIDKAIVDAQVTLPSIYTKKNK